MWMFYENWRQATDTMIFFWIDTEHGESEDAVATVASISLLEQLLLPELLVGPDCGWK